MATSAADAAKLATGMGFPVVLKIVSPEILHKTEAGGVLVGVKSAEEAEKGFDTIIANAKKYNAKANLLGVQVQQMLAGGQEVIIGAVTDPVVRQAGRLRSGRRAGRGAEGHHVPSRARDARTTRCRCSTASPRREILKGVRGADPVNRDALATMIQNVSQLIADFPEIAEMDLNPVFATKRRRDRRRRADRRRLHRRRRRGTARSTRTSCAT